MMTRSLPPASAHLADSPVPAPAPMMTPPSSSVARSLARASSPVTSASEVLVELVHHRGRELLVVDVVLELDQLDLRAAEPLTQRIEQRCVGIRVVERLALRVDHRHPAERHEQAHGPRGASELRGDAAAELRALLRGRAHEGDRGIVDVEVAALE